MLDCNRDPFGNAYVDSCGTCSGGKTRKVPSILCNPTTGEMREERFLLHPILLSMISLSSFIYVV